MTSWAGYEIQAKGTLNGFDNGGFASNLASTNLVPAYYAYIIGYYGHANNLPDGNLAAAGQANLTTGSAYLLLGDPTGANAPCNSTATFCADNLVIKAYASYAEQTHAVWPTKPFIWLIEGDFVQYAASSQVASLTSTTGASAALTWTQLGQLAGLIVSAIKTNMPNALVGFDDSTWISDTQRPEYWAGIVAGVAAANTTMDLTWTTGVGNNPPYETSSTGLKTGSYSWLRTTMGLPVIVDESAGASQASDTWSNQTAAMLNKDIADGVVAVNVSAAPSDYESNVAARAAGTPPLSSTCP
jgi:hypothetical protein